MWTSRRNSEIHGSVLLPSLPESVMTASTLFMQSYTVQTLHVVCSLSSLS